MELCMLKNHVTCTVHDEILPCNLQANPDSNACHGMKTDLCILFVGHSYCIPYVRYQIRLHAAICRLRFRPMQSNKHGYGNCISNFVIN